MNYIDFNQLLQLYRKLSRQTFRQVTGQKDTIHNMFLSNYPVEIVSTFCADSAHWRFYNKKRLIKYTLFISRVNSNVLAKQISSLVNIRLERLKKKILKKKKKIFFFFFFFFFLKILGAKADPRYKRTRVITRRVLTGLTCTICH